MEPGEHVINEGILSDMPIGQLEGGTSGEIETALCFLSYGQFEIGAEVRRLGSPRAEGRLGIGRLRAVVREDV